MEELKELYSGFLFGEENYNQLRNWSIQRVSKNEDDNDENINLLISSDDKEETIVLVRRIISTYDTLESIEFTKHDLVEKITNLFCTENIPERITSYKDNDPDDYDGEGQSVTEFFKGNDWTKIHLKGMGGYLLGYLTPEAFCYYLPAFLIHVISDNKYKTDLDERFINIFEENDEYWLNRIHKIVSILSCEQRKITLASIRFSNQKNQECNLWCRNARKILKC